MKEEKIRVLRVQVKASGTTVIVGYSIINGIIEERLSINDRPVKVRNFSGATVADIKYFIIPIIHTKLNNIILFYRLGQMMLKIYYHG